MRARHPVFVHASVDLSVEDARAFMDELRAVTGSRAEELKSTVVMQPAHRAQLLDLLVALHGRGNINLVDKSYFVCAKLIALLVEEQANTRGVDLAGSGLARQYASTLHDIAPVELGAELWRDVLTTYNDFIRSYLRARSVAPTSEAFFAALEQAREKASSPPLVMLLEAIWEARHFAAEYDGPRAHKMREMDPMASTLNSVSMAWRLRLGDVPMEFLADQYSTLTEDMCDLIVRAAQAELTIADVALPRANLQAIRLVDSRVDPRVQVADILGGVGREIARLAEAGTFDDDLQKVTSEMLDLNGMWSAGSPLDVLYERRPPRYIQAYFDTLI